MLRIRAQAGGCFPAYAQRGQRKMAQLRSYGIGFFLVLQNLAQLVDNYGEAAAKGILSNYRRRRGILRPIGHADGTGGQPRRHQGNHAAALDGGREPGRCGDEPAAGDA